MKIQISTSLKSIAVVLFSGILFTQAKAQSGTCAANFTYTVSGCMVSFTNTSTGTNSATNYYWAFGDGQFDNNVQTPVHTYTTSSTYSVCLNIAVQAPGAFCGNNTCKLIPVVCGTPGAIADLLDEKTLAVYPNPSNGKFQVVIGNVQSALGNMEMEVYNIVGDKVHGQTISSKQEPVSLSVPAGIYFLKITARDGSSVVKKIIKE